MGGLRKREVVSLGWPQSPAEASFAEASIIHGRAQREQVTCSKTLSTFRDSFGYNPKARLPLMSSRRALLLDPLYDGGCLPHDRERHRSPHTVGEAAPLLVGSYGLGRAQLRVIGSRLSDIGS